MTPRVLPAEVMINPAPHTECLVRYRDDKRALKREEKETIDHTECLFRYRDEMRALKREEKGTPELGSEKMI
jgi:hypothetical protein